MPRLRTIPRRPLPTTLADHIHRAVSPIVVLLSLLLIGLAAYGAIPPHVPFLGFVDTGVWV